MQPIYLHFCASIPGWEARNNPQSQKSCKNVEIFVSGLSEQLWDDDLVRADPAQHHGQLRGGSRERQPHTAQRGAMGGRRVPYGVVPGGRRAPYGAAAPTGAAALSQSVRQKPSASRYFTE